MGNLQSSESMLCCCKNDKNGLPADFVDIKAYEKESIDLAKKSILAPSVKFNLDSSERKQIKGDIDFQSLPSQKHQNSNSYSSIFSSTEFSLNEGPSSQRTSKLDQIYFKNKVVVIQKMFRKRRFRRIRSQSGSSASQYFSDSRPSINNHSLFLKHIIENSKQPELYQQEKDKKHHHSRTLSTNAANSYLHSNIASGQYSDRKNHQSSNELSCRKHGMSINNTCKLYKQKEITSSITELKQWLNCNSGISIDENCKFGVKLYNNGSKIVGFFNQDSNVDGIGYYESHSQTSYKGNLTYNL